VADSLGLIERMLSYNPKNCGLKEWRRPLIRRSSITGGFSTSMDVKKAGLSALPSCFGTQKLLNSHRLEFSCKQLMKGCKINFIS